MDLLLALTFPLFPFLYPSTLMGEVVLLLDACSLSTLFSYTKLSLKPIFLLCTLLVQAVLFGPYFSRFRLRAFSKILLIEHFKIARMFQVVFYCIAAVGATHLLGGLDNAREKCQRY